MARILSRPNMEQCLAMTEVIDVMRIAFRALRIGSASAPQRQAISLSEQGLALLMPSLLQTAQQHAFGLKLITVMPRNTLRNLPLLSATVLLLDAATGQTLAIMEGNWLTAMRTGAVSGLATDLLARKDAHILALFGAGQQAVTQVMAIHAVRPLRELRVVNRGDEHFAQLQNRLQTLLGPLCPPIRRAASSREALEDATLVACATASTQPLFHWDEVAKGTHINAIGAFTPEMCEVDGETLAHARIVVDQREAALAEAGDLLQALAAGLIPGSETWIELGDLVIGKQVGRSSENELTFFKSVGVAVQDVATALYAYGKATELGIGIEVEV